MKTRLPDFHLAVPALARAALVLLPTVALAVVERDAAWLQVSVMTMSTFIAHERSVVAPLGVALHALAILVVFTVLLLSQGNLLLFPLLCALFAMLSIRITVVGAKLRSLGNFTFVPGLYLAMEAYEVSHGRPAGDLVRPMLLMLTGALPTLLLASFRHGLTNGPGLLSRFRRLLYDEDRGAPVAGWAPVMAVAAAVACATCVVEIAHVGHGQWMIWSAASVVGADAAAARSKWRDRTVGASIGAPAGLALASMLPHDAFLYGASVIASLLTLVAFRSYVVGFGMRCMLVVVAIGVTSAGTVGAAQRVENVVLGGLIGFAFAFGISDLPAMINKRLSDRAGR